MQNLFFCKGHFSAPRITYIKMHHMRLRRHHTNLTTIPADPIIIHPTAVSVTLDLKPVQLYRLSMSSFDCAHCWRIQWIWDPVFVRGSYLPHPIRTEAPAVCQLNQVPTTPDREGRQDTGPKQHSTEAWRADRNALFCLNNNAGGVSN